MYRLLSRLRAEQQGGPTELSITDTAAHAFADQTISYDRHE